MSSGILPEQAHRLGRVEHRSAAHGDQQIGLHALERLDAGADQRLAGLGLDVCEDVHRHAAEVALHFRGDPASLEVGVGHDHRARRLELAQVLERARVEVGIRRHAKPLGRRHAPRHRLHVQQLAIVHVLRRHRSTPRAAPEREGRRERVVDAAERAYRGGRVHEDASGADREGVAVDDLRIARIDRRGVTQASALGDQLAGADAVLLARRPHQTEHGHQLLVHQRVSAERVELRRERCEQQLHRVGIAVEFDPRELGETPRRLPHGRDVGLAALGERELRQAFRLVGREQPRPHALELRHRGVVDRFVDHAGLLRRADHRRVEGLRDQDVDDRSAHVAAMVQVHRRVPRPDADARLPGLVRELHDLRPTRGPDHVDVGVMEEMVGDLARCVRDHLECVGRKSRLLAGLAQDLDRGERAADRAWRGPEQDRVARLGGDDRLEEYGRGGVRHREDRHHDAHRLRDVLEVPLGLLVDHADRLLVLEIVPEELGRDVVLHDLVLEDAEAGLLGGDPRERHRRLEPRHHHGLHDAIDLGLADAAERIGRGAGAAHDRVDLRGTGGIERGVGRGGSGGCHDGVPPIAPRRTPGTSAPQRRLHLFAGHNQQIGKSEDRQSRRRRQRAPPARDRPPMRPSAERTLVHLGEAHAQLLGHGEVRVAIGLDADDGRRGGLARALDRGRELVAGARRRCPRSRGPRRRDPSARCPSRCRRSDPKGSARSAPPSSTSLRRRRPS